MIIEVNKTMEQMEQSIWMDQASGMYQSQAFILAGADREFKVICGFTLSTEESD
jgi:hypothetical protein